MCRALRDWVDRVNRCLVLLTLMLAGAAIALGGAAQSPSAPAKSAPQHPTYSHDVAPILYANCVQCHQPGGSGPMSLVTYEDARQHARQIAYATRNRIMPPWLPDP